MPRLDVRQLITNTSRFIQSIQFPHEPLVLSCPEAQATEGDPPPRHREIYFWPPLLPIPPVSPMLPMPPRIYTASKFHSMRRVPVEIESCLAEKYCNAWNRMWDYCFRSRAYSLEQLLWDLQWLFWNRYGKIDLSSLLIPDS
jgi:hypothetical protein